MSEFALMPSPGTRVAVAGGCGGMGRVFVRAAVDAGLDVVVLDLDRSIAAFPPPEGVLAIACDASDEAQVADAFAAVAAKGPKLDALINLVGFTNEPKALADMALAEWNEIIAGSLTSAFLLSRAAIPLLREAPSAAIVHVSSTFGVWVPQTGFGPYAVAKAGIINLVRVLATECGPDIRVNGIAPGITQTAFLDGGTGRPAKETKTNTQMVAAMTAAKRIAQPEDMMGALFFLIGPGSRYVTSQTLHVNGGLWS